MRERLAIAYKFLQQEVAPRADRMDADPDTLRQALSGLAELGLLALRLGPEWGGPGLDDDAFRRFQEAVARSSGALAFLQTQHQSAGAMLAKSENRPLQADYLPHLSHGKKLLGIGFSQLRRPGTPALRATRHEGGYVLNGHVPWVTGWTFFPEFVVGAALDDGRSVFGIVPFVPTTGICFSDPMRLAAMQAALTVSADVDGLFLPDSKVLFVKPPGWIQNNDMINISLQGFFALGCAQAGLDVLDRAYDRRREQFVLDTKSRLQRELDECRRQMAEARPLDEDGPSTEARLATRAWAIELAVRCAHAGVTASSGAAISLDHGAQRVYREALVFTVSAQTRDIMKATLERLSQAKGAVWPD
jgi:alkylation response protein AidB-like acyl-CoA dehydrogenase